MLVSSSFHYVCFLSVSRRSTASWCRFKSRRFLSCRVGLNSRAFHSSDVYVRCRYIYHPNFIHLSSELRPSINNPASSEKPLEESVVSLLREVRSAGNLGSYRITFITSRRAAMTLYLGKYRNVEISGTSPEQSADFYAFAESLKTRERFKVVKMCQMRNEWKFLIYSFIYYNGKTH